MNIILSEVVDFFLERYIGLAPDNETIADKGDESRSKTMVNVIVADGSCTM